MPQMVLTLGTLPWTSVFYLPWTWRKTSKRSGFIDPTHDYGTGLTAALETYPGPKNRLQIDYTLENQPRTRGQVSLLSLEPTLESSVADPYSFDPDPDPAFLG
jgi:hypothetical protein